MAENTKALSWDNVGERFYETGVKKGVLYVHNGTSYGKGVAWNGLTGVTESPSGAEPTPLYANDGKYVTLMSAEEFGASIEAYTYPDEFAACDGSAGPVAGMLLGQQARSKFGFCYRTTVGNDNSPEHGYKLHIIYGCLASPSEKPYATINDSPEAVTFSWEVTTTPEAGFSVTAGDVTTVYKPTSCIVVDSTKFTDDTTKGYLKALEDQLYGSDGTTSIDPNLPSPEEVYLLLSTGQKTAAAA